MASPSRQSSVPDGAAQTDAVTRTRLPPMFRVFLHNDDYTPMAFVVSVLQDVFRKDEAEALRIMLLVHRRGIGLAGVYPFEIAETKVAKVHTLARAEGHPLKCTMEEA